MAHKSPGKSDREGVTHRDIFPTKIRPVSGLRPAYGQKGGTVAEAPGPMAGHNHMPYRCSDCRGYFSVVMASHLPLRKWVFATTCT